MRVAVVCPYDLAAPGGVQDQVVRLVTRLANAGHPAWAVAPGSGGPDGTRHVGRVRSVPANRSRAPIGLSRGTARRVRAAVADADVVHVHEPLMPMVSLAVLLGPTPPAVGTFHADPGAVVRGVYRGAAPVLRRLVSRLHVVTAVSPVARSAIARIADARIVPNGIDVEAFAAPGVERVGGRVAFLGRDEPRKGLGVLLEAWPAIRAAVPQAELRVIGAERDPAPEGVEFLGRVPEAVKGAELASAEVLVAPNLGGESFGIILTEAMSAGCAVVASDLPAFRAVAGAAARYAEPGDSDALAAAVSGLLTDPAAIEHAAAAGTEIVRSYDWDRVLDAYLEAYRDAVAAAE